MIDLKKLRANMAASLRSTLDPDSRLHGAGQQMKVPGRSGEIEVFFHPGSAPAKNPVVFELHGGGFAFGDASEGDVLCEQLKKDLEITVVSINYRRSPKHPFPAALEDVFDAIAYFHDHAFVYGIDPDRMAVFGHSAGGNLTAAVSILANRTKAFPLKAQLMTYPYLDLAESPFDKPKYPEALPAAALLSFNEMYTRPDQRRETLVSPVFAQKEDLIGLPPALILTAEFDSLNAEGRRYAELLRSAGVSVEEHEITGAIHGFLEDYFKPATSKVLSSDPEREAQVELQVQDALNHVEEMLVRALPLPEGSVFPTL